MRNLNWLLAVAATALVTACVSGGEDDRAAAKDSLWYHESDVGLLATATGPQLVEFFHPD
jgi:hypothetical protein